MNIILLQLWEISGNNDYITSDGCSLHTTIEQRNIFISSQKDSYEKIVGLPTEVKVSDSIFDILSKRNNIRLSEVELNNLIGLKEILPYDFDT